MKIAVLMGGMSAERQVSLVSGRGIVKALRSKGHAVAAIDAANAEVFTDARLDEVARIEVTAPAPMRGSRRPLAVCRELLDADIAFIAVHGGEGEDGTLAAFLELMDIPYSGSDTRACALTWDKEVTRRILAAGGVPVAPGFLVGFAGAPTDAKTVAAWIDQEFGWPVIVKPNAQGSTIGVTKLADAAGLPKALELAGRFDGGILVEKFIPGHELTVAVFEGKSYPVTEIVADSGFYDYERKYQKGHTRYTTPAEIPADRSQEIRRLAEVAFGLFGCAGMIRIDFRMTPEGELFCLEINTMPGMTELSLVPMGARAAGIDYPDLVEMMARTALTRKPSR